MDKDAKIKPINFIFNIALTIYIFFAYITDYLFSPEDETRVPWDYIYDMNQSFGITGAILNGLLLIFFGAYFVYHFWNRFLSDVFKIRAIVFQEALTIILFLVLFSGP
jgi:hypothetical protein